MGRFAPSVSNFVVMFSEQIQLYKYYLSEEIQVKSISSQFVEPTSAAGVQRFL